MSIGAAPNRAGGLHLADGIGEGCPTRSCGGGGGNNSCFGVYCLAQLCGCIDFTCPCNCYQPRVVCYCGYSVNPCKNIKDIPPCPTDPPDPCLCRLGTLCPPPPTPCPDIWPPGSCFGGSCNGIGQCCDTPSLPWSSGDWMRPSVQPIQGGAVNTPRPVCVPGPGASYSQPVLLTYAGTYGLPYLYVTCQDTGVTLQSSCGGVTFYHDTSGTKTYRTPGGSTVDCSIFHFPRTVGEASASGAVPDTVTINCPPA